MPRAGEALHERSRPPPGGAAAITPRSSVAQPFRAAAAEGRPEGLRYQNQSIAALARFSIRSERIQPLGIQSGRLARLVERFHVVDRERDVDRLQIVLELR